MSSKAIRRTRNTRRNDITIQVVSGLKMPGRGDARVGRATKYPWLVLKVGQAFTGKPDLPKSIRTMAHQAGKKYKRLFAVRPLDGKLFVWRVK